MRRNFKEYLNSQHWRFRGMETLQDNARGYSYYFGNFLWPDFTIALFTADSSTSTGASFLVHTSQTRARIRR